MAAQAFPDNFVQSPCVREEPRGLTALGAAGSKLLARNNFQLATRRFGQNRLVRRGSLCEGGARCEYRAEKAFRIARPDTPSLSNLPVHPLEI